MPAFTDFWAKRVRETAGSLRPEQALAQVIGAGVEPVGRPGQGLVGKDKLKFALLSCHQFTTGTSHSTSKMREWMSGRFKKEFQDLANTLKDTLSELVASGLIVEDIENGRKQPGRKVAWYRKVAYAEVLANPETLREQARLELFRDHFES